MKSLTVLSLEEKRHRKTSLVFLFPSQLSSAIPQYSFGDISRRYLVGSLENLLTNTSDFFFSQRISLFSENKSRLFNFNRRDCNNWEKFPEVYFLCQRPSPWGVPPLLVSTFLPLTISAILPLTRSSGKMVPSFYRALFAISAFAEKSLAESFCLARRRVVLLE